MALDTIIIGSGAGGLSSAICLSRSGQDVLVLEKHDVPGGWCHSFYLNGYRFTPGVHYIGLLGKGESSNDLYAGLGIANDLAFYQMNKNAYEHCWIGEERFDYPSDFNELKERLSVRFPAERKNIGKYLDMVQMVSDQLQLIPKMNGFWDNITIPFRTKYLGKYGLFSLKRVINWYVKDPLLIQILNIQCGDHGLPPGRASFPLHCAVMNHYFKGGFYPIGGGGAIVKAMTNAIKKHGGEIKTQSGVKRILLEGDKKKKAIGVELENGEKIYANRIISNADPSKTYLEMIGEENLSKKLSKRLNNTKYSCTSIMLFLTVDMDVRAAGLDSGNIWITPDRDTDDVYAEMMQEDITKEEAFDGFFVSCTTLKDPISFDGKYHTLEVITYLNHDSFKKFNNERTDEYLDFKKYLTNKMITTLEKVLPNVREHIVHKDIGTPMTNEYFVNSTEGNVYGTEKTLKQIGPMSFGSKSEIENLYLCGASILSHGVAGASYSGVQTSAEILGCKQDDLLKHDGTQEVRIYDAEDSTDYPEWMLKKMEVKRARLASKEKQ
jgi:all-trans-retinol 13,14-reductase